MVATFLVGALGLKRALILERAISDGWLTDTGDPALGAFVRMAL